MALDEFWISVRSTLRLSAPRAIADRPRLDAAAIESKLRKTTLWLTRRAVAGFDENDLSFLPDAERTSLAKLVNDFRAVASTVNPMAPAPKESVERALPVFREIILALEFDRYDDPEAYRLGKLIEREIAGYQPPALAQLRFHTGLDHSGDPALWIWVFVSPEASESDERFLEAAQMLRGLLDPVARRVAPDRWPYLSFRSIGEPAEPVEA